MTTDRIIPVPASEIEALRKSWNTEGGAVWYAIDALTDRLDSEPSMSDDERERMAWDLLPDIVRRALAAIYRTPNAWLGAKGAVIAGWISRMTAPPPWKAPERAVRLLMDGQGFSQGQAEELLCDLHDAGLLREDEDR